MSKVHLIDEEAGVYIFDCPGCGCSHMYRTKPHTDKAGHAYPVWEFNGDMEKPTFSPSLLVWASRPELRCHLFLRNGQI